MRDLELSHAGHRSDAVPELRAASASVAANGLSCAASPAAARLRSSRRSTVCGLMDAATSCFREGIGTFYAAQDVKLPPVTLKNWSACRTLADRHADLQASAALHRAGLGDFIAHLADDSREGKSWDQTAFGRPEAEACRGAHPAAAAGPAVPRRSHRPRWTPTPRSPSTRRSRTIARA